MMKALFKPKVIRMGPQKAIEALRYYVYEIRNQHNQKVVTEINDYEFNIILHNLLIETKTPLCVTESLWADMTDRHRYELLCKYYGLHIHIQKNGVAGIFSTGKGNHKK